jgi:hypothetical protein
MKMLEQPFRNLVGAGRAARAAVFPARIEHEVADDKLHAAFEEVEQARLAVRTFEDIVLFDPDHRQHAALDIERIARPGHRLLLFK